jgi:transcriptional regulator with XRE-family HTH domain
MSDSTDHLDTLPRRLEHARRAAGLNRSALAVKAGLNPSHVRLIEEGAREDPTGTTLARLAEALDVSLDWLVRGIGDAPEICDPVEILHDEAAAPARGAA